MNNPNKVPDFVKIARELKEKAHRYAGSESVKFFKESFVKEGFTDASFVPWKKTTNPMAGKRTMYNKGTLMQSVRKIEETEKRVVVESDTAYSEINNNGGTVTVTAKMKRYFWARYYELSGKVKTNKNGKQSTSKASTKANKKAEFFKALALMKVGSKIKIPKRQFMGDSRTMINQFDTFWKGQVEVVFKKHLNEE